MYCKSRTITERMEGEQWSRSNTELCSSPRHSLGGGARHAQARRVTMHRKENTRARGRYRKQRSRTDKTTGGILLQDGRLRQCFS
eukprot:gene10163-biopygen22789